MQQFLNCDGMKLVTGNDRSGLYAGLWEWLDTVVGQEGIDYIIETTQIRPGSDTAIISEILFVDPEKEMLARLKWPHAHNTTPT